MKERISTDMVLNAFEHANRAPFVHMHGHAERVAADLNRQLQEQAERRSKAVRDWAGVVGAIVCLAGLVGWLSGHDIGILIAVAGFIAALVAWRH